MKKIIGLIMLIILLTGCGTSKLNEERNINTGNNNSDKPSNSNKKMLCISEFEMDEDRMIISKYSFIFDKEGKKLETLIADDTMKFKEGRLSNFNIDQNKYDCENINNTANGLNCEYNVQEDGKISQWIIRVDYAKLDNESREIADEEDYLDIEYFNLEETKEYMKNEEYECEIE